MGQKKKKEGIELAKETPEMNNQTADTSKKVNSEKEAKETAKKHKDSKKPSALETKLTKENIELTQKNEQLTKDCEAAKKDAEEQKSLLMRTAAEYDNYRKRTAKEKESFYEDSKIDTIKAFLPAIDNMERALASTKEEGDLKKGTEMILKQLNETLKNLGVEEIETEGKEFDSNYHNAVMHVDDDSLGANVIVECFQKGYKIGDKVLRYSMVKVAN